MSQLSCFCANYESARLSQLRGISVNVYKIGYKKILKCFNNNNPFKKLIINALISEPKFVPPSSIMNILKLVIKRAKKISTKGRSGGQNNISSVLHLELHFLELQSKIKK